MRGSYWKVDKEEREKATALEEVATGW